MSINTSASAKNLTVRNIEVTEGKKPERSVNMRKQKLLGIALTVLCIGSMIVVEDVEALLTFVPFGLYLTFTKKLILDFDEE